MAKIYKNNFSFSFVIIIVIIILHYATILSPLENLVSIFFSPVQSLFSSSSTQASIKYSEIANRRDLFQENQKLNQKINQIEHKIVELQLFIEENELLIEQNTYLESQGFNFVNAKVLGSNVNNNPNLIIINRGEKDDVKKGMAVVVEGGTLIGKIFKTNDHQAFVLLINSNSSKVDASISDSSEITGIIEGENNLSLKLKYILKNNPLEVGDLIITSGADNLIPTGLLIGEVDQILEKPNDLFKQADISSPANFKNLRIVSVVLN